jgi:hypothetical protein
VKLSRPCRVEGDVKEAPPDCCHGLSSSGLGEGEMEEEFRVGLPCCERLQGGCRVDGMSSYVELVHSGSSRSLFIRSLSCHLRAIGVIRDLYAMGLCDLLGTGLAPLKQKLLNKGPQWGMRTCFFSLSWKPWATHFCRLCHPVSCRR